MTGTGADCYTMPLCQTPTYFYNLKILFHSRNKKIFPDGKDFKIPLLVYELFARVMAARFA